MSQVIEAVRKHHRSLERKLNEQVQSLVEKSGQADPRQIAAFLRSELAPHASGEEKTLYPAVEPLLREHGQATATMHIDHEFIADYIGQIEVIAGSWQAAKPAERAALEDQVRDLSIKLAAIWELHLTKEERVYLPMLEKYLAEDQQRRLLGAMHDEYAGE